MLETRAIPGHPDYEATSDGQILGPNGPLKQALSCGYARVKFRQKQHYVHCLIAYAFLGPRPPGMIVGHRNGDLLDNRADNLEYTKRWSGYTVETWLRRASA